MTCKYLVAPDSYYNRNCAVELRLDPDLQFPTMISVTGMKRVGIGETRLFLYEFFIFFLLLLLQFYTFSFLG